MRWALLGPLHPYRGGIAHYGALLADALARVDGDSVEAVNFSRLYPRLLFPGKTQFDASASPLARPAPRLLASLNPISWRRSADALAATAPDALVCHWWHPFFAPAYGAVLRRLGKLCPDCARILLCHNVLPHERGPLDLRLGRYAFGGADGFLVHSASDESRLLELLPAARRRVHPHPRYEVFRGGAPSREAARASLDLAPDARVALFFGYVRAYKGLDIAIQALARSAEPGIRLLVVGEFYEDQGPYDALIESLCLQDRVRIVNRYVPNEEVALYFQAADLVLQPYRSATQSGIAQIAFAFGRPVLATAVGGLPEQIEDGVSGLLVPPEDPAALAAALDRFFAEDLAAALAAGIAAEAERFSWSGLVGQLRELADDCAADGEASP